MMAEYVMNLLIARQQDESKWTLKELKVQFLRKKGLRMIGKFFIPRQDILG